jgi:hypothetical protein
MGKFSPVSSIYTISGARTRVQKTEAKMADIEELLDVSSSPFLLFFLCGWQGVCRNFVFRLTLWFYELII